MLYYIVQSYGSFFFISMWYCFVKLMFNLDKNLDILKRRAFMVKWKVFFIIFKGLSFVRSCLRPRSMPLKKKLAFGGLFISSHFVQESFQVPFITFSIITSSIVILTEILAVCNQSWIILIEMKKLQWKLKM